MTGPYPRVTQQDIARMTGVSQTTVSIVLNGRTDAGVRIAPETRDRVLRAIAETGYVADPVAQRMAAGRNRIVGVFTYEPVFPTTNSDFYHPFLIGIEEQAETLSCDLLLLTSAPVVDGRRRIFHEGNRLRLADGCILLGNSFVRDELAQLVASGLPFVSIGRRDDAGGPVPYVGSDYATVVAALVGRAADLGHERVAYLGYGSGPESWADRMCGFCEGVVSAGIDGVHITPDGHLHSPAESLPANAPTASPGMKVGTDHQQVLGTAVEYEITAVFTEDYVDAVELHEVARSNGVQLSVAALGEPLRPIPTSTVEFSGFRVPSRRMGAEAFDVLAAMLEGDPVETQRLLPCELVVGETLMERR